MILDTVKPSPNGAWVEARDPEAKPAGSTVIPTDTLLVLGKVHPNTADGGIVSFREVDELFGPDKYGEMEFTFSVPDVLAALGGDAKKAITARHTINAVRGFSFESTVTKTVRADATGLEARPLLAAACRLYFVKDFTRRQSDPAFREVLTARKDEYLGQLGNAAGRLRAIGTGGAADGPTDLVEKHLSGLSLSLGGRGTDVALNPPHAMLSDNDADNAIFARARPITVHDEPFEMPQSDFLLDRLETERRLVEAHAAGVDIPAASEAMSQRFKQSIEAVFAQQKPYQEAMYSLQQAAQPGPRGKGASPARVVNRSLASLADDDGKGLRKLLEQLPGRRATDFSRSVDTIYVHDELADERQAKLLGEFAEGLRAVAVVPIHTRRKNDQAAAIHASQFGTLHGIRRPEDSHKRYVFPVAGSFLADTDNPVRPTAAVPHAAMAAGMMIRNADKIALAPAGDRMRLEGVGAVTSGEPLDALANSPDPREMPGVNRVNRRTDGFYVLHGASTLSDEPTFQLAPVTRSYNDLVKNISELLLTELFNQDTADSRKRLEQRINKLIMAKSGTGADKSLNGGKVLSVETAKGPDGTPLPGVLEIKLKADFKYVLFGVEVKVIPEDVTLLASKGD